MNQVFLSPLLVFYLGIMSEVLEAFCGTSEQNEKTETLIFFSCANCLHFVITLTRNSQKVKFQIQLANSWLKKKSLTFC